MSYICVNSKFPLIFNKLHEEIISKQDGQLMSPTTNEAQPLIPFSLSTTLPPACKMGERALIVHFHILICVSDWYEVDIKVATKDPPANMHFSNNFYTS